MDMYNQNKKCLFSCAPYKNYWKLNSLLYHCLTTCILKAKGVYYKKNKEKLRRARNMSAVTKKSTIGEVLNLNLETAKYFMEMGMHCLGCPASQGESIEEACMVHGTDADELVAKLNEFLKTNP